MTVEIQVREFPLLFPVVLARSFNETTYHKLRHTGQTQIQASLTVQIYPRTYPILFCDKKEDFPFSPPRSVTGTLL